MNTIWKPTKKNARYANPLNHVALLAHVINKAWHANPIHDSTPQRMKGLSKFAQSCQPFRMAPPRPPWALTHVVEKVIAVITCQLTENKSSLSEILIPILARSLTNFKFASF
jgi:hypothetical protein